MIISSSHLSVLVGIALFIFAGYETLRHRDMLKLTQQEYETVPLPIVVEVLLAAALCMWGSVQLAGSLKPISAVANQEGLDAFHFRPDFMSFSHRGHAIPLSVEPIGSTQSRKQKKAQ